MLGTLGLGPAASLGFMMAQQNVAAQNVVDKGANLKITDVRMFNAGGLYVRIQTNAGITGWGETYGLVAKAAIAICEAMGSGLKGENPTRIEHIWQRLYRGHRDMRRQGVGRACLSFTRCPYARQDSYLPQCHFVEDWARWPASIRRHTGVGQGLC